MKEAYFHEDDYCQQELLPLGVMEFCQRQIVEINDFAEKHKAPDGAGWTDVFIREDSPQKLRDMGITIEEFRGVMGATLAEYDVVCTGYGSLRGSCRRTAGFGFADDGIVFVDWADSQVVESIWTSIFLTDEVQLQALVDSLQTLGTKYELLYADWAWGFAVPLDGTDALMKTIRAKVTEIEKRSERS